MGRVYFVPGLLGSELDYRDVQDQPTLWVDPVRLGYGEITALELGADGINPAPGVGAEMEVGGVLDRTYGDNMALLRQLVAEEGDELTEWGYDWRKSLLTAGSELAEQIALENSEAGSVRLLTHSAGGLVARIAWFGLVAVGRQDLVSRIVTLGTPHYGSYAIVDLWSDRNDSLTQLWWLNNVVYGFSLLTGGGQANHLSREELIRISMTWPALYEVLPQVNAPNSADDPWRPQIYDAAEWPQAHKPSQLHLTAALEEFLPIISSPNALPPYEVLTTYAGYGYPTSSSLITTQGLLDRAYLDVGDGDNSVSVDSAAIADRGTWRVQAAHEDLAHVAITGGSIKTLLYEVKELPPPPPEDVDVPQRYRRLFRPPPMSAPFSNQCGPEGCVC